MNIQLPSLAGAAAAGLPPRRRGRRPPAGAAVGKILLVINHSKVQNIKYFINRWCWLHGWWACGAAGGDTNDVITSPKKILWPCWHNASIVPLKNGLGLW